MKSGTRNLRTSGHHSGPNTRRGRFGVTLIEVLVTMGVFSILVSLLLPAVLSAMESARKTQCLARLGQLSKACHNFEASRQNLPSAQHFNTNNYPADLSPWGQLLPFIDQTTIFRQINMNESGAWDLEDPQQSLQNGELMRTTIALFVCPSDVAQPGSCNFRACLGSHYAGYRTAGVGAFWSPANDPTRVSLSQIRDGLSQTVLCSERLIGDYDPTTYVPARDVYLSGASATMSVDAFASVCQNAYPGTGTHRSYLGSNWFFRGHASTSYNHVLGPNSAVPDCDSGNNSTLFNAAVSARSWHRGGVNVTFADGATRLVNQNISLSIWRAIGTRAGNDVVSEW